MKRTIAILLFQILISGFISAQDTDFQQKVDYDIYALLYPDNKTLDGDMEISYTNNSSVELNDLYLYLYANEFKSNTTKLAAELIEKEETGLYFAKDIELGGYNELNISIDNKPLDWEYANQDKTLVKVHLKSPIKANDKFKFKIKYKLKIPKNINGFGYAKNSFLMTNWYPKVLVYDENGWNIEEKATENLLFSEYGDYNVSIRIPENFIVSSSGKLTSEKEKQFLNQNIINKQTDSSVFSSLNQEYKTLEFTAKDITDFAWFTSPNLLIKRGIVKLDKDNDVQLSVYYDSRLKQKKIAGLFEEATKTIKFYYTQLGFYPTNDLDIVISKAIDDYHIHSNIITIPKKHYRSNKALRITGHLIAAQVIDNSLNSNKYKFPWISHGLSSFYHMDYLTQFGKPFEKHVMDYKKSELSNLINYKSCSQTLLDLKTGKEKRLFLSFKPALSYNYLKKYLGQDNFNQLIKSFVSKWKYKHINSNIIRNYFEKNTKKDLNWFFDGLIADPNPFRYSIVDVNESKSDYILRIKNEGKYAIPLEIGGFKNDSLVYSQFVEGFKGEKEISLSKEDYDKIEIDPNQLYYKNKKLKTRFKLKNSFHFPNWLSFYKKEKPTNFVLPSIRYNYNDGYMAGLFLTGSSYFSYEYKLAMLYGFRSKSLVGDIDYRRTLRLPYKGKTMDLGINARRYHRFYNPNKDFNLKYSRISPYVNINFGKSECKNTKLQYMFSYISDEEFTADGVKNYNRYINNLSFTTKAGNTITPISLRIGLEHQIYKYYDKEQYLMFNATINSGYMYKKDRFLNIRLYGATYLFNTNRMSTGTNLGTLSLIGYAENDYGYQHYFIDRAEQDGFWSRQLMMNTGGFKTALGSSFRIGQSNSYVMSANIVIDLPFKFFIKPYLDLGIYGDLPFISEGYSNKFLYSSGLVFQIMKNSFEIYLPIVNSKEIEDIYREKSGGILKKVSFLINLNSIHLSF